MFDSTMLDVPFSAIQSKSISTLHEFWISKRLGHQLPKWSDVDPSEITSILPNIFVVRIEHDPMRVLYKIVGTKCVNFRGEVTGRYLDEVSHFSPAVANQLTWEYRTVVERQAPIYSIDNVPLVSGVSGKIYGAIYPLTENGQSVERCIAIEDYGNIFVEDIDDNHMKKSYRYGSKC